MSSGQRDVPGYHESRKALLERPLRITVITRCKKKISFDIFPLKKSRKPMVDSFDLSRPVLSGENRYNQYAAGS